MRASRAKQILLAVLALSTALVLLGWLRLGRRDELPAPVASAAAKAPRTPRPRPPDIHREPRGAIAGTVTDPQKAPVAGAAVCATFTSPRLSAAETRDPICVRADASGRYRLADLMPARYQIAASAPRYRPARFRGPPPEHRSFLDLDAGQVQAVDFALAAGGVEVRGHVKDVSGGVIREALVVVTSRWEAEDEGFAVARTDTSGAFSTWVAEGPLLAEASADGYANGHKQGSAPGVDLEILLTPESVLVGKVMEAGTEDPVPGAEISLDGEWGSAGRVGRAQAITDERGRFTVRRLAPGRYKPTATAPGRYGQARESVLLGLGETSSEVVVEVHPAFDVAGKVTLAPEGGPCTGGEVNLEDREHKRLRSSPIDKEGAVRFQGVLPGSWDVKVSCSDRVPEPRYPPVVVASSDVRDLSWTVRAGLTLRGRLVDREGRPVAGNVRSSPKNTDPRAQRTEAFADVRPDGTFSLSGLLPGKHTVSAMPQDRPAPEPVEVDVSPGSTAEVKIVVEGGGGVAGSLADEDGHPIGGARITALGPKYAWNNEGRTQADGSFTLTGLAPGAYRLRAESDGAELRAAGKGDDDPKGTPVTVKEGAVARVKLVVERRDGEIHGQVVDEQGRAVTDAFLQAERESESRAAAPGSAMRQVRWSGWSRPPALTDTEGKFTLSGLSRGKYTVHAFRKGGGETFAEHVQPGEKVTITFRPTGSIAGIVTLARGGTPEQVTLRIADKKSGLSRSEGFFRTGGVFTMSDVPPGTFEVSADAPEGTAMVEVPLAEGEQKAGVALSLSGRVTIRGQAVSLDGAPVPGMRVSVRPRKGMGGSLRTEDPDRTNITDDAGRFTVTQAPAGEVTIMLVPLDWETQDFGFTQIPAEVGDGPVADVGTLVVPKRRVRAMDRGGDLGFTLEATPPGTDSTQVVYTIAVVRPEGPAAVAGLVPGDVVVSVDGRDVTGKQSYLYSTLTRVGEGTSLSLGLKRGTTVSLTAGKLP